MPKITRSTIWISTVIGVLVIGVLLLGWILFVRGEQTALSTAFEGRGFSSGIPFFEGTTGSTNSNIADSFLGRLLGGERTGTSTKETITEPQTPRLWQISNVPSAGVDTMMASTTVVVTYAERPTGHLFEANTFTGDIERITNTLIPQVQKVSWIGKRGAVVEHTDDRLETATLVAHITRATSTEGTLEGTYLEPGVIGIAGSPDKEDFFYLLETVDGSVGIISTLGGEDPKRLFSSSLVGWQMSRRSDGSVLIVQNASEAIAGSAFLVSPSGREKTILSNVRGLSVAIHPKDETLVYSESVRGRVSLFGKIGGGLRRITAPFTTLADKCVFAPTQDVIVYCAVPSTIPSAPLPDAWYRGEVHFSDSWWQFNLETGEAEQLLSPESDYRITLDVVSPKISSDGSYIVFLDSLTQTPWGLRIQK